MSFLSRWPVRLGLGLAAGAAIACIDEGASEVTTIIVLLLATTAAAGAMWGPRAWITVVAVWACLPLAHLIKHLLGLPDMLQPNTYASILLLAAFTLVVAAIGAGGGLLIHALRNKTP